MIRVRFSGWHEFGISFVQLSNRTGKEKTDDRS